MDYGFANFEQITLKQKKLPSTLPVSGGIKTTTAIKRTATKPISLMLCESDKITIKTDLPTLLKAPVRQGDILGYEKYYLNGELLFQSPVIADGNVNERDFDYYLGIIKKIFFLGSTGK